MEQEDQLLLDRQLSFLLSQSGGFPLHLKGLEAQSNFPKDQKLENSKLPVSSSQKQANVERREFRCNFCGNVKRGLSELVQHERIHTGDKPYTCRLCSKGFAWKQSWKNHEKICHRVHRKKKNTSTKTSGDEPTSKEADSEIIKTDENETSQAKDSEDNVAGPSARINSAKFEGVVKNKIVQEDLLLENQNQNPSLIKRYKCNYCPQRFVSIVTCQNHRLSHNSNISTSITQFNELKTENTSNIASNPESAVKQPEAQKRKQKYRKGRRGIMKNMGIITRKTLSAAVAASNYYQSKRIQKRQITEKQNQKQKQACPSRVTLVKVTRTTTTVPTAEIKEKIQNTSCIVSEERIDGKMENESGSMEPKPIILKEELQILNDSRIQMNYDTNIVSCFDDPNLPGQVANITRNTVVPNTECRGQAGNIGAVGSSQPQYNPYVLLKRLTCKEIQDSSSASSVKNHKQDLNEDATTHFTRRPYKCNQLNCGKAFKSKSHLDEHGKCHSDLRPFGCPQCGKTFKFRRVLVEHERCHTGERPHKCPVYNCNKTYGTARNLRRHTRNVHQIAIVTENSK